MPDHTVVDPASDLFPGRRMLDVPTSWAPTLLVVVDTEEEFDWRAPPNPESRSVTNVQRLPALQAIFERHQVVPAYLVDHPVADSPEAVSVLRRFADAGTCEIGAHLHPWVTPPVEEKLDAWHAFAGNLPAELERRKLETLTQTIRRSFGADPHIFKAGGYGVGGQTSRHLADLGYRVDSSVVPFTDFTALGGPNFQDWTAQPFQTREGIVEIPLSAGFAGQFAGLGQRVYPGLLRPLGIALHLPGIAARLALLERLRLSPEGHTLLDMIRLTRACITRGERLFMLTLHSSAMLPGATEYVRSAAEQHDFLQRIDRYLRYFHETLGGTSGKVSDIAARLAGHAPATNPSGTPA